MSNTSMNTSYGLHRDGSGNLQNLRSYLNGITPADTLVFGTVAEMTAATIAEGALVQTKGYYTPGDSGGALYLIISGNSGDGQGDHNIGSNTAELLTEDLNLLKYGFGPDEASNNAAFSAAIQKVREKKSSGEQVGPIVFPGGDHAMSGYFLVPPYARIKPAGNVILRHTGGGTFLHISYDSSTDPEAFPPNVSQNPFNVGDAIGGAEGSIALVGDLSVGSIGLELGLRTGTGSSRAHTAWMNISNLTIDRFETSHFYNNTNTFLIRWYNCLFTGCSDIIKTAIAPNTNSGEQINYVSCGFHNSDRIGWLRCPMNLELHGCSLDYMTGDEGFRIDADFQRISFLGGWFEAYSATQDGALITSNTGASANRLHVNIDSVYIQPRDKQQIKLVKGPCTVSLTNNTFVVNRFDNFPNSADGAHHYLFNNDVVVANCKGNKWFDQMVSISPKNGTRNPEFSLDPLGTTATQGSPTEITGWTLSGIAGQSDLETVQITQSPQINDWAARIDQASGTFCNITSDMINVSPGSNVYQSVAIYSPTDASINVTQRIRFYDDGNNFITEEQIADYSDYPADRFVTHKASNTATVPSGATKAEVQFVFGGYSSDLYIYGAGLQSI